MEAEEASDGIIGFPIRPGVDLRNINSASPRERSSDTGNVALPVPVKSPLTALRNNGVIPGHRVSALASPNDRLQRGIQYAGTLDEWVTASDAQLHTR